MKTLTCPECGVTFTTSAHNQICCSPKCTRRRTYHAYKKSHSDILGDPLSATAPVSMDTLSRAKEKPENTSAVRWRIELRRRAIARRFGHGNTNMLPHPDFL